MSEEEFSSGKLAQIVVGADLSMLSVDELEKRIIIFEQEISRIREDVSAKQISKQAAESIFRL